LDSKIKEDLKGSVVKVLVGNKAEEGNERRNVSYE